MNAPPRVAHVVTLVSPDGAFGGPLRVALNLSSFLLDHDCRVTLVSTFRGYTSSPKHIASVPVVLFRAHRLFPGPKFSTYSSLKLIQYLVRNARKFDALHIHMGRDLVALPAAAVATLLGVPTFIQTHGMVRPSKRRILRVVDLLLTRPILRSASRVFYLNEREREDLVRVAGTSNIPLTNLRNGVPATHLAPDAIREREVVFLGRLHPRKRPATFVAAAGEVAREFPDWKFTLIGPDEGEGPRVESLIHSLGVGDQVRWEGALPPEETTQRLARASVFVHPAENEPFGMSIIEAMSAGLPTIITSSCEIAQMVRDPEALLVTDGSTESIAQAIRALLADPDLRRGLGARGQQEAARNFSIDAVGTALLNAYQSTGER